MNIRTLNSSVWKMGLAALPPVKMRILGTLLVAVTSMSISGCAAIGGMQTPITADDLHHSVCPSDADLEKFQSLPTEKKGAFRDDVIATCIKAINQNYLEFKIALQQESVTTNLTTDVLSLGLTSGAALSGGSTAKDLSAAAAVVLGVGSAINKDVFYQQTLPAIEASMDAHREVVLASLLKAQKADPAANSYTLASAAPDLDAYEAAGNMYSAITELTKAAHDNERNAKDQLDQISFERTEAFSANLQQAIKLRDVVKGLTDAQALTVAKAMEPNLATRPANVRSFVTRLDRSGQRLKSGKAAKKVLSAWAIMDERDEAALKEWNTALSAATP